MYTLPKDLCYLALVTFANVQHDIVRNHEIIETMSKKSPIKLFDQHPFSNCNGCVCNDHLKSNRCDRNGSLHQDTKSKKICWCFTSEQGIPEISSHRCCHSIIHCAQVVSPCTCQSKSFQGEFLHAKRHESITRRSFKFNKKKTSKGVASSATEGETAEPPKQFSWGPTS